LWLSEALCGRAQVTDHASWRACIVIPQLDCIAVFTAWNIYDERSVNVKDALERLIATVRH